MKIDYRNTAFIVSLIVVAVVLISALYIAEAELEAKRGNCTLQCEKSGLSYYDFEGGTGLESESCMCKDNEGYVTRLW